MNRILAAGRMRITNPNYISQQMFDVALRQKFLENPDDDAVTQQALRLTELFRGSLSRQQVLVDIAHAAKVPGHTSMEQAQEIAFAMGLQFGFELALSYPPLSPS
jgi:hypothetical protein